MRQEWGDDEGTTSAAAHRAALVSWMDRTRAALDAFRPDFVLLWGDDQYENFREDIIPAFCVFGLDEQFGLKPWHNGNGGKPNRWGETGDWTMKLRGARDAAKHLAGALIERGIDMAYAYKPLHVDGLAHAFTNTLLYLDWDRRGFPWPVLPFAINCYGRNLIHAKGGMAALFVPPSAEAPDPPAPQPWRCMDVGRAVAEVLAASPWRVAVIASSSWSHCFLSPTNGYLWPDHKADRLGSQSCHDLGNAGERVLVLKAGSGTEAAIQSAFGHVNPDEARTIHDKSLGARGRPTTSTLVMRLARWLPGSATVPGRLFGVGGRRWERTR